MCKMDNVLAHFVHLEFPYIVRAIYNNDNAYKYLVWYFLDKISDPCFQQELEQAANQRWFLCESMASWIPYDDYYAELVQKIKEFAAA